MHYAPRTIALTTELFHPPIQPDPAPVQRVHNRLFQEGDPPFKSFAVTPFGAVLSNAVTRPGAVSQVSFLADRFQFREELGSQTVEDFAASVRSVADLVAQEAGNVQVFTAQQVTLRTLVNPRNFTDSREFLKLGMFGFQDQTADFGREPQLFGIRMHFPATQEQPCAYALRIESFSNDPRSVFLENTATYAPILVTRGLEPVERNVLDAYEFLVERALRFLGRFDSRQEAT
jgi:hypothetical protein